MGLPVLELLGALGTILGFPFVFNFFFALGSPGPPGLVSSMFSERSTIPPSAKVIPLWVVGPVYMFEGSV